MRIGKRNGVECNGHESAKIHRRSNRGGWIEKLLPKGQECRSGICCGKNDGDRLRWFGMRRDYSEAVRCVMKMNYKEKRGSGKRKRKWINGNEGDMKIAAMRVYDM